ncbi:MAG: hypothetical protein KIS78_06305 [Labilithrix sp.]|nr:hypothetical protein [Labilithrix sp.]
MTRPNGAAGLGVFTLLVLALAPSVARGDEPLPSLPPPSASPPAPAPRPSTSPPSSASSSPAPALPSPAPAPHPPAPTPPLEPAPSSASSPGPPPKPLALTPPAPRGRGVWRSFRAGADLVQSVPTAAILDGAWSISLHVNTELTNRTWDKPYPTGSIGQYSTRILYGGSWTLMLGLESLAVVLASKGNFDWIGDASYRTDWVLPVDLPACSHVGARGGCGLGVGSFSFLQIRPRGGRWWYEAGGGWIQQRVLNDALRTVAESSWVLTPISALYELRTDLDRDVAVRLFAGPGVYFGMHTAHLHPTRRGMDVYTDVPWTQMYPLDAGIGPGARVEGRLIVKQHLSLEGELVMAPFLLGGPTRQVSSDVAPLDVEREGMSVWRKVGLGIGWDDPRNIPFKATLAFFGAELSERPIHQIGYRGGMLRFDIPLRVPGAD